MSKLSTWVSALPLESLAESEREEDTEDTVVSGGGGVNSARVLAGPEPVADEVGDTELKPGSEMLL